MHHSLSWYTPIQFHRLQSDYPSVVPVLSFLCIIVDPISCPVATRYFELSSSPPEADSVFVTSLCEKCTVFYRSQKLEWLKQNLAMRLGGYWICIVNNRFWWVCNFRWAHSINLSKVTETIIKMFLTCTPNWIMLLLKVILLDFIVNLVMLYPQYNIYSPNFVTWPLFVPMELHACKTLASAILWTVVLCIW